MVPHIFSPAWKSSPVILTTWKWLDIGWKWLARDGCAVVVKE
jgi:hypothetical protein